MATILAIDDEKDILNLIRRILSRDGHLVETLSDSAAVEAARPERFDLILLDVMMPGMDGFALCEMLRERVDCPILFLTAKTDESSLVCGLYLQALRRGGASGKGQRASAAGAKGACGAAGVRKYRIPPPRKAAYGGRE